MDIRFESAAAGFEGRTVLEPLSLSLAERRIGVIGLNGSGKTTFARMINGLTTPVSGRVLVNGRDTVTDTAGVLGDVGFIFQNPQNQIILPVIREDIGFGLKNRGMRRAQIDAAVDAVLGRFGVAHLAGRRAHELSGGELQLAALCAVLVTAPRILILDEPTSQLDLKNRAMVERVMESLEESLIVITHDLPLIEGFDRALVFHKGQLAFDGAPHAAIAHYKEIARA